MSKFILPLLVNLLMGVILYFVINNYPKFIYPTIFIEFIVYIGIVELDMQMQVRKENSKRKKI